MGRYIWSPTRRAEKPVTPPAIRSSGRSFPPIACGVRRRRFRPDWVDTGGGGPSGRQFYGPAGRRADEIQRLSIRLTFRRRSALSPARTSAPPRRTATPSRTANRPHHAPCRPTAYELGGRKLSGCANLNSIFDAADIDTGDAHALVTASKLGKHVGTPGAQAGSAGSRYIRMGSGRTNAQ